ncbi:MAG: PAS domain S-box protein [Deltaproteobacteria bacterium]|nr:PAS domain S-box protein [Deltaproteobacteria bacterium]
MTQHNEPKTIEKELEILREKLADLEDQNSRLSQWGKDLQQLESIMDLQSDLICRFLADGTLTFVNNALCAFFNQPRKEMLGRTIYELIPHEERDTFRKNLASLDNKAPFGTIELRLDIPGKNTIWLQWLNRALFDEHGTLVEFQAEARNITSQIMTEENLIEALDKYWAIFQSSNDAIMLLEENRFIDCNDTTLSIFGPITKEQFLTLHPGDVSPPEQPDGRSSKDAAREHISIAMEQGFDKFHWMHMRADGSVFPADVLLNRFEYKETRLIAAVVRDISEQTQTEEALKKSQEKYRFLVENINDALFSVDNQGLITYISPVIKTIIGYTPEELIGKNFLEIIYKEDKNALIQRFDKLLSGVIVPLEYRLVTKNNDIRWIRSFSRPVYQEGKTTGITGVVTDITKRKLAEQALHEAYDDLEFIVEKRTSELRTINEKLRKEITGRKKAQIELIKSRKQYRQKVEELQVVLDGITDNITLQDHDLKILLANKAAADSLKLMPNELIGKKRFELWHNRSDASEDHPVVQALKTNSNQDGTFQTPDGNHWEIRAFPLQDENGKVRGAIEISRNVTSKKKLEEEMQKREMLDSLGRLAGGIAHDFNNILTAIIGNISLSKMLIASDSKIFKRLSDVEKASFRAKELAQQLLTFSKGGMPIKKKTAIRGLLVDTCTFALHGSNIKAEFSAENTLWPLEIDEGQIAQVIHNIVINAVEAMPQGGTIRVVTENVTIKKNNALPLSKGRYVKISFHDEGVGIEKEVLDKIFDPFFSTKEGGSGLGLAISYSIVKKHSGHITAISSPNRGSSFFIYLPASSAKDSLPGKAYKNKELIKGSGSILLMDDEEFIRDITSSMLNHLGFDVVLAKDGQETIELFKKSLEEKSSFRAVVLDLTIPGGMGGLKCIEHLLKMDPQVRAIASSGYSNDPVIANPEIFGFSSVIVKPYKIQDLSEVLSKVLEKG